MLFKTNKPRAKDIIIIVWQACYLGLCELTLGFWGPWRLLFLVISPFYRRVYTSGHVYSRYQLFIVKEVKPLRIANLAHNWKI